MIEAESMTTKIESSLSFLESSAEFVELTDGAGLKIDLRYASQNNFMGLNVYGSFTRAFLHQVAAEMLDIAVKALQAEHPEYRFIVFDALRPRSIQRILWKHVVGTEGERYMANPDTGSLHNFGFAIDLSVLNEKGVELDMGAGYDDFRLISHPALESRYLETGELTSQQFENRLILRRAMETAGFIQLPHEWWHFDALPKNEVRSRFTIVE